MEAAAVTSLHLLQTDWDIQALFMRIDKLCSRYSREMSQVSWECQGTDPGMWLLLSAGFHFT